MTVWLEGISHCNDGSAADAVEKYLGHEDQAVREAAVRALRNLDATSITQTVIGVLAVEPTVSVRTEAARTLAQLGSDEALAEVSALLASERRASIRAAIVDGLASGITYGMAKDQRYSASARAKRAKTRRNRLIGKR